VNRVLLAKSTHKKLSKDIKSQEAH